MGPFLARDVQVVQVLLQEPFCSPVMVLSFLVIHSSLVSRRQVGVSSTLEVMQLRVLGHGRR